MINKDSLNDCVIGFTMPRGEVLEIFTNADPEILDQLEMDQRAIGIYYYLFWGNNQMPMFFETLQRAYCAAFAAQWAAKQAIGE